MYSNRSLKKYATFIKEFLFLQNLGQKNGRNLYLELSPIMETNEPLQEGI
jgi:hypothetical protein